MDIVIIRIKKLPSALRKEWRRRYDSVSCRWDLITAEFKKLEVTALYERRMLFFKTFHVSADELLAAAGRRSQEAMLTLSQALEGINEIIIRGRFAKIVGKPATQ